ncbi:carbohydrate ABC transporter permease [Cryobacterium sp. TMS1-20-1]|uniref:carbohydrate ABC transporter permease n=1 Tax=Cryobacterium sp. TMS1-20-1 TaxID=1259223 RepID=UPI00106913DC|nr:carbohydrate ABC transporter permease [Cryobacterium sp. TMS1-20-1]TFC77266.1 carbohydrate ABC transporter permease [Cryobacterium sp. TMS1-20-1]
MNDTVSKIPRRTAVSRRWDAGNAPHFVLMCLWAALAIAIFLWIISNSVKSNEEIFGNSWGLPADPIGAGIQNYLKAWNISNMGGYFLNSMGVTVVAVISTVGISAPAAYALSRIPFLGSRPVFYYFVAGMGLPFQLILVPLYVLFVDLGLVDSTAGLVVAFTAVSIPFTILLLTGFFRSLPTELEEAAAIDGSSEFGIFFRIMMPVATPGLFTAAIFNFVTIWQEYLLTALLITSDENRTLPVGLMSMRQSLQYSGDWASMFAGIVIVVIPSFIIFVALSNRIMAGLTMGSGK